MGPRKRLDPPVRVPAGSTWAKVRWPGRPGQPRGFSAFGRTRRLPPCLVHGRDVAPPPAPELGVLDPNRCHHAVDHRLSRLPRTRHREQVRIVHGRAKGHVDALEDPWEAAADGKHRSHPVEDRKSTRLNSSHGYISYAVFCLKK